MKNYKTIKCCIIVLAAVCTINIAGAQEVSKVGTSAATFLKIPVGARAAALGGAYVAVSDDPTALFWNPGGLPRIEKAALLMDYSPWLPGIQHNFFGMVLPVGDIGTIGLSLTSLGTDKMDVTTRQNPMGTGETFDAQFIAVGFSYGRYLTDRFSIGATLKFINERIYNSEAFGIAVDIGTIYNTPLPGLKLGFNVSNFGTKMRIGGEDLNVRHDIDGTIGGNNESIVARLKTDEFDLPLLMQVGVSYEIFASEGNKLLVMADGVNPSDNTPSINSGLEFATFNDMFILRGGYTELFLEDQEKGLTLGLGFNTEMESLLRLNIGYSYQAFKHLPDVSRYSIMIYF
jgi:hypothetical protein